MNRTPLNASDQAILAEIRNTLQQYHDNNMQVPVSNPQEQEALNILYGMFNAAAQNRTQITSVTPQEGMAVKIIYDLIGKQLEAANAATYNTGMGMAQNMFGAAPATQTTNMFGGNQQSTGMEISIPDTGGSVAHVPAQEQCTVFEKNEPLITVENVMDYYKPKRGNEYMPMYDGDIYELIFQTDGDMFEYALKRKGE